MRPPRRVDQWGSLTFGIGWLAWSAFVGAGLWVLELWLLAGLWLWACMGLGYWAMSSRVLPADRAPVPPATTPDYSDRPLHTAE